MNEESPETATDPTHQRTAEVAALVATGEPIGEDRLEELPWARFSIEAARMRERMGGGRP